MSQLDDLLRSKITGYPDPNKVYSVTTPVKAVRMLLDEPGWSKELEFDRDFTDGKVDQLVVLSRAKPLPPPPPPPPAPPEVPKVQAAATKVREVIRGRR